MRDLLPKFEWPLGSDPGRRQSSGAPREVLVFVDERLGDEGLLPAPASAAAAPPARKRRRRPLPASSRARSGRGSPDGDGCGILLPDFGREGGGGGGGGGGGNWAGGGDDAMASAGEAVAASLLVPRPASRGGGPGPALAARNSRALSAASISIDSPAGRDSSASLGALTADTLTDTLTEGTVTDTELEEDETYDLDGGGSGHGHGGDGLGRSGSGSLVVGGGGGGGGGGGRVCSRAPAADEVFDRVGMRVSFTGGIVSLEWPPEPESPEIDEDDLATGILSPATDFISYHGGGEGGLEKPLLFDEGGARLPRDRDDNDIDDGDGDDSEAFFDAEAEADVAPVFELRPTNVHRTEEERQRKRTEVRLAVLDQSAAAYRRADLEVPDELCAQINELRRDLAPTRVAGKSGMGWWENDYDAGTSPDLDLGMKGLGAVLPGREAENQNGNENGTKNREGTSANTRNGNGNGTGGKVRKIRVTEDDEIHALPCQCALKLVGMRGMSILGGLDEEKEVDITGSLHSVGVGGDRSDWQSVSSSVLMTPVRKSQSFPTMLPVGATSHYSLGPGDPIASTPVRANRQMKMTKTPSASAGRDERQEVSKHFYQEPQSPIGMLLGGPVEPSAPGQPNPHEFKEIEYHEITLIRKNFDSQEEVSDLDGNKGDFVDWEAVTIRCKDHDESDAIISALRASARANVVPFSPDPRAKLKKRRDQELRARLLQRRKVRRQLRLRAAESENSFDAVASQGTPLAVHARSDLTSPLTPPSAESVKHKGRRGKRENESKKWNKSDSCEICDFRFTLLTRRHHCRKCDRSCCGDCSSVILVRGGDERRYCNRCSNDVIRKQSRDLRRRLGTHIDEAKLTVLPGKVHEACLPLGVGVLGKLPHWRNYSTWNRDRRPAVGRITVELIEAMALPSVDVHGKSDPYVRATITGYDRDLRWNLKEWLPNKTFSLTTEYRSGTLAPVWYGTGRKGGQLLTLPVVSTAGAMLRLEVFHYNHNVMTHARGKDQVLGVVEIPLSDFPNANLRTADDASRGKKTSYDGYCDRWYRLQMAGSGDLVTITKPIPDPHLGASAVIEKAAGADGEEKEDGFKNALHSLNEIGERIQKLCETPVEWIGTALHIDMPRRPDTGGGQRRNRAAIHVRIKLNCNEVGDVLSHVWFPPIEPWPAMPSYDPQILFRNIVTVGKRGAPYRKIWKFVEESIKWKRPPKVCVTFYAVFAAHLAVFPYFLYLAHLYLYIFLWMRLRNMIKTHSLDRVDSFDYSLLQTEVEDEACDEGSERSVSMMTDDTSRELPRRNLKARSLAEAKDQNMIDIKDENLKPTSSNVNQEEVAKLNRAVEWIAKRLGEDKGLEVVQYKLGLLGNDLRKVNSLWDGSSVLKTRISMIVLIISLCLHFRFNHRVIWLSGTFSWYFGLQSPFSKRAVRSFLGIFTGSATLIRRRQLHDAEIRVSAKKKIR